MNYSWKIVLTVVLLFSINSCYYDNEEELYPNSGNCDTTDISYSGTIAPIIESNCNVCHSQNAQFGGIITEGHSNLITLVDNGKLWGTVNHTAGFKAMPQNANKLSDCKISQIKIWIDQGAQNN